MTKRGRKAKPGKRYAKNRRLTREARQEDVMETATEARMRHYHLSKTAARDPDQGFPLGRLHKRGYISQAQYEAGNKFADAMRAYLGSKIGSTGTAPAQDVNRRGASLTDRPVQREDEARAYMDALADLDRLHSCRRSTTSIVWEVCLTEHAGHMDENEIGRMREGLNAIGRVILRRERMAKRAA
jgi:hypothetical protein